VVSYNIYRHSCYITLAKRNNLDFEGKPLSLYQTNSSGIPIPGKTWDVREIIANHSGRIEDLQVSPGVYSFGDPYAFIKLTFEPIVSGPLQGDADRNGIVDALDYTTLKNNFGKNPATWEQGNFDGDTDVDWDDLQMLMGNFGSRTLPSPAQNTPEPATLGLLALGGLAGLARGKKR
jgi:hypothetical protein